MIIKNVKIPDKNNADTTDDETSDIMRIMF